MEEDKKFHFDGKITAGNVLTAVSLIASILIWGMRLEGRVDAETQIRVEQHSDIMYQINNSQLREENSLREIKQSLYNIDTKLDGKADKGK